ncbi:MAG: ABC transporter permease [Blastocatellia bacterium]
MNALWQDLRYGARMLLKNPVFALIAVITLALGIGANTAIFSVVNAVLLRALPFNQPERLVTLTSVRANDPDNRISVSYADFLDWQKETATFAHAACYAGGNAVLTVGDEPERIRTALVTEEFFAALGAPMLLGRAFTAEESKGGAPVVVISHGLRAAPLRRQSGHCRPEVSDRHAHRHDHRRDAAENALPGKRRSWLPMTLGFTVQSFPDMLRRDNFVFQSIARLQRGVTPAQASARLDAIARHINEENPKIRQDIMARAIPLLDYAIPRQLRLWSQMKPSHSASSGAAGFAPFIATPPLPPGVIEP